MKYDVRWRETFDVGSRDTANEAVRERYDLALALRIVRRMETSAGRAKVFEEIKAKNLLYRFVDATYSKAGGLQPVALFAYMLKCVLSVGPSKASGAVAVSISNFANEHRAIDRVAGLMPDSSLSRLTLDRRHIFAPGQLRSACRMLATARRTWPFLSHVARSHSFMPAARIASALAFYIRFVQLFADQPGVNAAVVPSNYSPESVGMAAAAHRMGRKVIYINHAPVPANGALVPPVLADCAIFYGEAIRKTYERGSRCLAEVALIGQPWVARPMEWRNEIGTVGIFLTSGTRTSVVSDLVSAIRVSHPSARIIIRNHPVALLKSDFSELTARHENLAVTIGNPLDDEIAACDLIVCGNSGVAMNAVSGGRPVAYMDTLDGSGFDYNGFVESGLICHVKAWTGDLYALLKIFYGRPEWRRVMRSYDASYGTDAELLRQEAAETVRRHLGRTTHRPPAATPARPSEPVAFTPRVLPLQ